MSIFVLIVDGGADHPIAELADKTPFEWAHTPSLDYMAQNGLMGLITIIDAEIAPETDSGSMALLSYDPLVYYTGRGPLEGLGAGLMSGEKNEVCFRINFASLDPSRKRIDRRTSRDLADNELQALVEAIQTQVKLSEFPGVEFEIRGHARHRGIVRFKSTSLPINGNVSNTDPGFVRSGYFSLPVTNPSSSVCLCSPMDDSDGSGNMANIINAFSKKCSKILSENIINKIRISDGRLPSNCILMRDGGDISPNFPRFDRKFKSTLSYYGQIDAERGLAKIAGGHYEKLVKEESQKNKDFLSESAVKIARDRHDVVFVHLLKEADEAGHDGNAMQKAAAIAEFDQYFLAPFLRKIRDVDICIVTSDHATPCGMKIHSKDPVPVVIYGRGIPSNGSSAFGERNASLRQLPIYRANELLPFVLGQQTMVEVQRCA